MMNRLRKQRGFALMAVLGITVLLMIYLVSVQGAAEMTRTQTRLANKRQEMAGAMAALVTVAMSSSQASSGKEPVELPGGQKGRFSRKPLAAGDAFWNAFPLLRSVAGDELLTAELDGAPRIWRARFIVNRSGARPGVVTVEAAAPVWTPGGKTAGKVEEEKSPKNAAGQARANL